MTFSFCFCHNPQHAIKSGFASKSPISNRMIQRFDLSLESVSRRHSIREDGMVGLLLRNDQSFLAGSTSLIQPNLSRTTPYRKNSKMVALCLQPSQVANVVFTLGTIAVLPFYTFMVVAPRAQLTRRTMESYIPYIVLGLLYAYMLYVSWTPETLHYMFGNGYWMPELSGMLKMFSSEMTMASAWIHLLSVDLFTARQVYQDGLQNDVETRHSVILCLLFCPIGVLSHVITKALVRSTDKIDNPKHKKHVKNFLFGDGDKY
ncbi:hypothetical protein LIER_08048 [Lithospermum erythrorhizon]|uniref:Neoxanthin synthase n=1 Tax=Lithospermum erythrorhizon TaxID=34254 RepID=A0AAV3PET5_LITER